MIPPYDLAMDTLPAAGPTVPDDAGLGLDADVAAGGDEHRARPPWFGPAIVGASALAGCVGVFLLNPVQESNPPICPFKMITGLDCPGCGATRAANALLHGHLATAADHNLLFVALLPLALVMYAVWALRSVGATLPPVRMTRGWIPALVVVTAAFWGLRLLPWEPFHWLASSLA